METDIVLGQKTFCTTNVAKISKLLEDGPEGLSLKIDNPKSEKKSKKVIITAKTKEALKFLESIVERILIEIGSVEITRRSAVSVTVQKDHFTPVSLTNIFEKMKMDSLGKYAKYNPRITIERYRIQTGDWEVSGDNFAISDLKFATHITFTVLLEGDAEGDITYEFARKLVAKLV